MIFSFVVNMIKGTRLTFNRFTPSMIAAVFGSSVAIYLTYVDNNFLEYEQLFRYIFCAALGLPLFMAIRLYSERKELKTKSQIAISLIALGLLIGYFFTLPQKIDSTNSIRFALLIIGMHLLVSFSAFIANKEINGFWQFNKALFLRLLTSLLFSGVLFIGLALAILAIDKLFSADIDGRIYARLWFVIAGVFNTWFFLSGIPSSIENLDAVNDYPKGLKIFSQYILLPLVLIYFMIIYAYTAKIIVTSNFPSGWVSNLVLFLSVAGIFSLLLINPIKDLDENKWIKTFRRLFYIFLLPMLALLAVSIWKRIDQYGVTENRYFIVVLNAWLVFISLYFIFSKSKNIKMIPSTLCVLALLTCFGPWGAFSVSIKSQKHILEKKLTDANILVNGKIQKTTKDLSYEQGHEIVSTVGYLEEANALDELKPWFKEDIDTIINKKDRSSDEFRFVNKSAEILELMGINESNYLYSETSEQKSVYYYSDEMQLLQVKDFDYLINFEFNDYDYSSSNDDSVRITGYALNKTDSLQVQMFMKTGKMLISLNNESQAVIKLSDIIHKIIEYNNQNHNSNLSTTPNEIMMVEKESDRFKIRIYFKSISGLGNSEHVSKYENISAKILLKLK
jgi:uncharacterized membrane protein YjfL (UPF0719 family)